MEANQLATFGDIRRMIIDTIVDIKNGSIETSRGMAIAAHFKVLNENVQVEINAAKLALLTENKAHSFGRVVGMGRRLIGNDGSQDAS
ncbi:hypothetical protein [Methylibium sp.]|uniref:hypothetical protein n=1 Tax=Methylibium sp. TaxID=2067992 RepID=UPI003D0F97AB